MKQPEETWANLMHPSTGKDAPQNKLIRKCPLGGADACCQAAFSIYCQGPYPKRYGNIGTMSFYICHVIYSAAEEYITRCFAKDNIESTDVLFLCWSGRRLNTVSLQVRKYCSIKDDKLIIPGKEEIKNYKVVVTTMVTSLVLTNLKLKGHFSHIFIDEAAQVC
jgi:hypothetical protein